MRWQEAGSDTPTREELAASLGSLGIRDERVIAAFRAVPRARFVPEELSDQAYLDQPLPIGHDQVTTQPSLIASMLEALRLRGDESVLEIGAGHGFQTALLARLARSVHSVERWPALADAARANLERHGAGNVEVVLGDGSAGLPEHAPYEAILVSAAFPEVPRPLAEQLADGGRLVQPLGPGGDEQVIAFVREGDELVRSGAVTAAHFVRLYGAYGFRES